MRWHFVMEKRRNLVLTGFMGTGKSALGRRVALRAGVPFLEMDEELERRAGKPIPRIFAEDGEGAFREMESALAAEWGAGKRGAVISCGGGVVLREGNLGALGTNGLLVCLVARPEVIAERTLRSRNRPLLETEDRAGKIRELLAGRAPYYARVPVQFDTSDGSLEALAERLLALWEGKG